ncbi:MAG: DUF202 domain-containing protein [Chlorobi bacterium]|nr:DUF202 domain-containing protein [Chlorobiota bacterium]
MLFSTRKDIVTESPYRRFEEAELILRDELAIDRTILANERTLLSYLRSGVALLIAGVSIIHYAHDEWFRLVGLLCLPVGIVTGVIGVMRYRKMHQAISRIQRCSVINRRELDRDSVDS